MDSKTDFLMAAISDTQATIRAIDVKVAALLVGILAPFANTNRVFGHLGHFGIQSPQWLTLGIAVLFLCAWLFGLAALVRAIGAIDNPAQHIINASACVGSFHAGGLYKLGLLDVFLNRDIIKASKDPLSYAAQLPDSKEAIEGELVFEQMKLAYIRDVKFNRLAWGMRFSLLWFILGIGIFISSKYFFE